MVTLSLHRVPGRRRPDGGRPDRLLFLVHGFARTAESIAALGELLDPDRRFALVAPRGPLAVEPEGATFYDVDFVSKQLDEASFARALGWLDRALDEACTAGGFDRAAAVVAGFSQGGGLALALALGATTGVRPAAVVAFSPPIHPPHRVTWDLERSRDVATFVAHGTADELFPADAVEQFAARLEDAGMDVTWRRYATGHQVVIEELAAARDWLAAR